MFSSMTIDPSSLLVTLAGTVIPAVVGFLLSRSIKGVDRHLDKLNKKVDLLTTQDTKILIELAELRTRVMHLEFLVMKQPQQK